MAYSRASESERICSPYSKYVALHKDARAKASVYVSMCVLSSMAYRRASESERICPPYSKYVRVRGYILLPRELASA